MKNRPTIFSLVVVLFSLLPHIATSQLELWGMTSEGGLQKGVIFKTDSAGENFSIVHYFENRERHSKGTLIKASNGKYYGMSEYGGNYGLGCIFEYNSTTDSVFILHHFDGEATGSHPKGDLLEASNGNFYGMTRTGGTLNDRGVVFELDLSDTSFTKIYEFGEYPRGRLPEGSLIEATNGKLYGMTNHGGNLGAGGSGTIFEIDLAGPTLTYIHHFSNSTDDGLNPKGNLLCVNDSLLYGYTPSGGIANQGTVFAYNINTGIHTKLHDFDGLTCQNPTGSPVLATNGNLYGLFQGGSGDSYNGGIFEYDIDDSILSISHNFGWTSGYPSTGGVLGSLVEGKANMLFGMTNRGGAADEGTVFKFNCVTNVFTKLIDFDFVGGQNYNNAYGSLIESTPGKYLGMTNIGGTTDLGTIFEYDTTTESLTTKHSFNAYSLGENPTGSLLAASNGRFYGLTYLGGKYNAGTLFEYHPFTESFKKLHDFNGTPTGANPYGSLIEADDGMFYGMTKWGGVDGQGVLFEFDPATGILINEYDFGWAAEGKGGRPIGRLIQASNGKLYGMTSYGGINFNRGTLFEYDISTNTFTKKHDFYQDGRAPEGSLIETQPGILYGLTKAGGTNDHGTLFEYVISSDSLTVKHHFSNNTDGREPSGDLITASNGKLYGLASNGGTYGHGTVFEFDTVAGGTFTTVYHLQGSTTGSRPYGSLVESSNGNLFGMCHDAAYPYLGTLFKVDTSTNVVTKLMDFDFDNGSKPQYTQLVKVVVGAIWTGAVDTDWHNPANWLQNAVPDPFTDVLILDVSTASGNFPVISTNCRILKLTVTENAMLTVPEGVIFEVNYEQ